MAYRIMGSYQGRTEEVDCADSAQEAKRLLREYRMAFGAGWALWLEEAYGDPEEA